ncbi:MAG TPA: hypothetical protein VGM14_01020 [Streptosporangiaceae bacterium]
MEAANDCTSDLRTRLSAALKDAMRARDQVAVSALRSALGAIGNAEAVPVDQPAPPPGRDGPHFAGAVCGLAAAEMARLRLTPADLDAIMRAEISERERAADDYAAKGFADQAERLRREASILSSIALPADHE